MREPLPLAASVEATGHDPADAADQTELIDELKAAIAELPDRQREAVVLRDFYGLSYREVATAMTVSVPVVESLLFRARRHLNRRLGNLPRLAQGALTIPLALRDELARAIPGFDAAAAELGSAEEPRPAGSSPSSRPCPQLPRSPPPPPSPQSPSEAQQSRRKSPNAPRGRLSPPRPAATSRRHPR